MGVLVWGGSYGGVSMGWKLSGESYGGVSMGWKLRGGSYVGVSMGWKLRGGSCGVEFKHARKLFWMLGSCLNEFYLLFCFVLLLLLLFGGGFGKCYVEIYWILDVILTLRE